MLKLCCSSAATAANAPRIDVDLRSAPFPRRSLPCFHSPSLPWRVRQERVRSLQAQVQRLSSVSGRQSLRELLQESASSAVPRLCVIVPFRRLEKELSTFVPHISAFLRRKQVHQPTMKKGRRRREEEEGRRRRQEEEGKKKKKRMMNNI
jgi:hypothetical protein